MESINEKKSRKSKAEKSISQPQIEEKGKKQQEFFSLVTGKFSEGLRNLSIITLFLLLYLKYREVGEMHLISYMALLIAILAIFLNIVRSILDIIDVYINSKSYNSYGRALFLAFLQAVIIIATIIIFF
ncbi:hypothetical protein ACLSZP_07815 [Avibacterium avium]|uniref:hypothetical protein n=1 Tax=Avibacterium avium TaxID=751 RepID=UPI003BF7CF64